jgi:amidase
MSGNSQCIPELIRLPATDVITLLKKREVTPADLLDTLEQRIHSVDPMINALPTLCFDRARVILENSDPDTLRETPLAGLPLAVKDLVDVSGVRTTHGSLIYADNIAEKSDILVSHLESAGTVVYAKSNTPEFGTGANTVNAVFGATRNPWDTGKSAAGSSGGAAAALASGTAWLAHGSDMGGSLRNPASFCGVVGLRPTPGRIATTRSASVSNTLSTDGPMARNVSDIALMLDAMCGHEPGDPLSFPTPETFFSDAIDNAELPESIAWSLDLGITPVDPRVRLTFESAIAKLEDAGVKIRQVHPDFSGLHDTFDILRAYSFATSYESLLEQHEDKLNPNVAWNIREGLKLTMNDVIRAEAKRLEIVQRVQAFFNEHGLLLTPSTIVPAYPVEHDHVAECDGHQFENYYQWLSIAYAFTISLSPAISIPCGFTDDNLPVGLQIAGASYNEAAILNAAAAMEEVLTPHPLTPIDPKTNLSGG